MWTQEIVKTARGDFEIFRKGEGRPLCSTHLYSSFNELGDYFTEAFTDHFSVILVNLREAGNSCKAQEEQQLSMAESVYDLEAIREALGYDTWAFAGHSTGGMLGLKYAILAPDSLAKVIVGGAASSKRYMMHPGSIYCKESPYNKRLLEILNILKTSTDRDERRKANKEWSDMSLYYPEKRDKYFQKPSSGKTVGKRLDYYSYTELPEYDITEELTDVSVPVFVYCGVHDAQCPYVFSEEIANQLTNSRLYSYRYSNHFPFIEEKKKFNKMVHQFAKVEDREILDKDKAHS
ncbi:alpha/beta fold hydrolase [Oceanobacillus sp. J11TS1]|uniref:alpha/beta fold hydrolase n=1 Tax=Oceanobacillus sp. J11TS1 TaxID=2807191 RepID=UPI001B0A9418|nr:alpha/beta hydrolase [Oceanobacillus sp. J11TS1]GIO23616.1 proline iminopeptidase [Oceanobacillus sp. J11TS1]